ncbi:MAG TPA: hypothetical protein VGV07_22655 [Devosia sp.]|jgi:hypothetical protein|uniref:hypothetical protein n=1 Tax=Devosia sp. TaxID=1871048 RepID=UPI002DDD5139|nr:hypothetical protein [Devosia sp.]HEV2518069.1 hypothetical protein [Devosia sp.]
MRASSSKQPLAGDAAWWITAFMLIVVALSLAASGGSLIGAWSTLPHQPVTLPLQR